MQKHLEVLFNPKQKKELKYPTVINSLSLNKVMDFALNPKEEPRCAEIFIKKISKQKLIK